MKAALLEQPELGRGRGRRDIVAERLGVPW